MAALKEPGPHGAHAPISLSEEPGGQPHMGAPSLVVLSSTRPLLLSQKQSLTLVEPAPTVDAWVGQTTHLDAREAPVCALYVPDGQASSRPSTQ